MRIFVAALAAILLVSCSEAPAPTEKKTPAAPPMPITGRQALQYTSGPARIWAADSQPLTVRSMNVEGVKSEPGKAGMWEVIYVSPGSSRARTYTWSAIESETIHKGVFAGQQESWRSGGQQTPFLALAVKIDTPDALQAAREKSYEYLQKPGVKPPVNYLLEFTPRFPDPVWRVLWGNSVSSAEYAAIIDAATGKLLGKN